MENSKWGVDIKNISKKKIIQRSHITSRSHAPITFYAQIDTSTSYMYIYILALVAGSHVVWGYKIRRLHFYRQLRLHPYPNECPGYNIKLTVRLQPWSFKEYGVPLHCHWSLLSAPPRSGSTWERPIYGLNRTVWHLNYVKTYDLR